MRKCEKCNVNIQNDLEFCPLCKDKSQKIDDKFEIDFPQAPLELQKSFIYRILIFVSIALCGISVIVNVFTTSTDLWSIIVIVSFGYAWMTHIYGVKMYKNWGFIILIQTLGVCCMAISIDLVLGFEKWSTNYVIPGVIAFGSILNVTIILIKPMKFYEYIIYEFVLIIMGAIPLILLLFRLSDKNWTSFSCISCSALILIGIFVFSDKNAKQEIKRRLHS